MYDNDVEIYTIFSIILSSIRYKLLNATGALFFAIGGIYRMAPQQFECTFLIVYKSELHFQRKTVKDMPHMKFF